MDADDLAAAILLEHPSAARPPWTPRDEPAIESELRGAVSSLLSALDLQCRAVFDHYGSGYASFVDAWFFRDDPSFGHRDGPRHEYTGLAVLLCRLAPVFCLMEGSKSWDGKSRSSYLPAFECVDDLRTEAVRALAPQIERELVSRGYVRLRREALEELLPGELRIPTILSDGPFRKFDALFHWED